PAVVARVVERGTDVVAHAAVDAHVAPRRAVSQRDVLDGAHLVEGDGSGTGDGATRLDHDPRGLQAGGGALLRHDRAQLLGQPRRRGRVVLGQVGDTQAAPEVE